jgi:glutathione S-transferase
MSKPTLHGAILSPYVRKVRVALAEKGIEYDSVPVMPFGVSDEFKAISPLGKIPCYQEGDFTLPDSTCILAYLEAKGQGPALVPKDPQQFGRTLWYEEYADTKVASVATVPFFQRFVRAAMMTQEADEAAIRKAIDEDGPHVFGYLEKELEGREYLAGGQFTIADIATASFFVSMEHGGEKVDAKRWPKLADYLARVHGRPSYKAIIEEEKAMVSGN